VSEASRVPRDTSDARPSSSLVKTDYEADCLPTERPARKLAFRYALNLTDTWPNSFSISTASMACLNLSYMQMQPHVLLEEDDEDTRELVPLFSRVSPNPRQQSAHLN
jgi:hypothetical protein